MAQSGGVRSEHLFRYLIIHLRQVFPFGYQWTRATSPSNTMEGGQTQDIMPSTVTAS